MGFVDKRKVLSLKHKPIRGTVSSYNLIQSKLSLIKLNLYSKTI